VIACFQNGIDYAVAGMGTSLTHEQARTLLLMSNRVVLAYDQDDAGKKATMRAVEVIRQCGGRAYVARYDGAKDPDEFMQRKGIDEFICIIKSAVPDIEYLFSKSMIGLNTATVDGKIRAKEEVVPILALLKDDFELQAYLDEFSRNIGVEKDSLAKEVELYSQSVQNASKYKKSENRNTRNYGNRGIVAKLSERQGLSGGNTELDISRRKAEEGVIRCLVENTRLLQKVQ
jgi:DNA primase